jgi:hypothetical protein
MTRTSAWLGLVLLLACSPPKARPASGAPHNAEPRAASPVADEHATQAKRRLPDGFSMVVEPPFVVIGDGPPALLASHAESTVRWAVSKLKQDYFTRDPERVLDVWLFKDEASYNANTRAIFGDEPDTPYGYYSSSHGALIMNIATGGGTLVHEIVHPFIESNFPDCPAWFNEGLGSLYEQAAERDGHIIGRTNWRLAGLQRAIRRGGLMSFASLTATSNHAFYEDDRGTNYAQARYLLYYLQERGLLVRYYHEYFAARATDPTGYATLQRVLGESDMAAFQRRWEQWVLTLAFP